MIQKLNDNPDVHGILCQLPLPKHICEDHVIQAIDPQKDVDGFHPQNVGALVVGKKGFVSCTPAGIIQLLKRSNIEIAGKHCVVIGRSNIVGKPMALLMLRENATVTICHSRTENLKEICKEADILIVAIGKPRYIGADISKKERLSSMSEFTEMKKISCAGMSVSKRQSRSLLILHRFRVVLDR